MTELRERANRWVLIWASITMILLIALGAAVIGLIAVVSADHAGAHASKTANCVNNLLGDRAVIAARDSAAHVSFAGLVSAAVAKQPLTPYLVGEAKVGLGLDLPSDRPLTEAELVKGINAYARTLIADQQERDAKPLGKC